MNSKTKTNILKIVSHIPDALIPSWIASRIERMANDLLRDQRHELMRKQWEIVALREQLDSLKKGDNQ